MLETKKRILFFSNFSEVIDMKFISDESAFQELFIGIPFFSFCKVVEERKFEFGCSIFKDQLKVQTILRFKNTIK